MIFFSPHHWAHWERNNGHRWARIHVAQRWWLMKRTFVEDLFVRHNINDSSCADCEHCMMFYCIEGFVLCGPWVLRINENEFWLLILSRKSQFHSVEGAIFQRRRKTCFGSRSSSLLRLLAGGVTADASLFIRKRGTPGLPVTCHSIVSSVTNEIHLEKRN